MKTCSKCKQDKPLDAFHKRLDAYAYVCKECKSSYVKEKIATRTPEQVARDREKAKRNHANSRDKRLASMREYASANSEKLSAYRKSYYESHKHEWVARRRADLRADVRKVTERKMRKLRATPAWAKAHEISEVYGFAQEFIEAGIDVHVDHIEPLRGKLVCGLHVEHNLRVCLADANRSKGNRQLEYFQ